MAVCNNVNVEPTVISGGDGSNAYDAFGRLRVSNPLTIFDSTNVMSKNNLFDVNEVKQMIENARSLPGNNLRTEVTKMDLQKFKQPMTQTMDYDTYMSINPGSTLTPYEFEQLKQGNITQPGTYVG